ncbi:MAG: hypothetical protein LBT95_03040, partial [Treponema sp.]|nr:hypothetical protein [Treponema sp.]
KQQKSTEQINIAIADISNGLNSFIHSTEVATASAEGLTRLAKELETVLNARAFPRDEGKPDAALPENLAVLLSKENSLGMDTL